MFHKYLFWNIFYVKACNGVHMLQTTRPVTAKQNEKIKKG